MATSPSVAIIIPTHNEASFIEKCLDSLMRQASLPQQTDIYIIDAMSTDETREIIRRYSNQSTMIHFLDNPQKFTSHAFNIGIKSSNSDIVMLMGAHALYPKNYIAHSIEALIQYKADNIGGILKPIPTKNTPIARAITHCLSHPFGTGNATFRLGTQKPKEVDTVFGGCYKRKIFEKIGYFNEMLNRSQDIELNLRLKRSGGKTLLIPTIYAFYYPKATLKEFLKHNVIDGIWAIYPLKFVKIPLKIRHYVPFAFVTTLVLTGIVGIVKPLLFSLFLVILGLYFSMTLFFSTKIALQYKSLSEGIAMPLVFITRHFGYGFGCMIGCAKLFLPPYDIGKKKIRGNKPL